MVDVVRVCELERRTPAADDDHDEDRENKGRLTRAVSRPIPPLPPVMITTFPT
jgi:hypothetical protein